MANAKKETKPKDDVAPQDIGDDITVLDLALDEVPDRQPAEQGTHGVKVLKSIVKYSSSGNPMFVCTLQTTTANPLEVYPFVWQCLLPTSGASDEANAIRREQLKQFCQGLQIDLQAFSAAVKNSLQALALMEDTSQSFAFFKDYEGEANIVHETYEGEARAKIKRFL